MHTLGCLSVGFFIADALWDLTPLYVDWQVCCEAGGVGGSPLHGPKKERCVFPSMCVSVHARLLHLLQKVCAAETGSAQLQAVLGCFFLN